MEAREHTQGNLQLLRERLDSGRMRSARLMVHSLHPAEIARLLESLPLQERALLWEMVSADDEGDVLVELSDEVRDGLIEGMQTEELIAATAGMDFDDLADLLADLPEAVTLQVLQSLDKLDHDRLQQVLAYDEDCAGGLMNIDIVTVRPDVTLEVVTRYLRAVGDMPDGTDLLFVVNRDNEYVGSLFLSRLLTHDPDTLVSSIMSTDVLPIPAHTPSRQVVWEFENRDLLSAPVVDDDRVLDLPLPAGSGGEAFRSAVEERWLPRIEAFEPELLLVSAGFDAHARDHLAGFALTEVDFDWLTRELVGLAETHASGRVVSALEGGYDLGALAASVSAHVRVLMGL